MQRTEIPPCHVFQFQPSSGILLVRYVNFTRNPILPHSSFHNFQQESYTGNRYTHLNLLIFFSNTVCKTIEYIFHINIPCENRPSEYQRSLSKIFFHSTLYNTVVHPFLQTCFTLKKSCFNVKCFTIFKTDKFLANITVMSF